MVDFHSHILPEMDDGAENVETALEMLKISYLSGIRTIVATPHYYPEQNTVEEFLQKRKKSYEILKQAISSSGLEVPNIVLGAEVLITSDLPFIEGIEKLKIGGTNCIILEMPYGHWYNWVFESIYRLIASCGLTVVTAHIERYNVGKRHEAIQKLFPMNVYFQANASSFFHKEYSKRLIRMLKKDMIHLIGSDCHDMVRRPPGLSEGLEEIKRKLKKDLSGYFENNALTLLAGGLPEKKNAYPEFSKRKFFKFW